MVAYATHLEMTGDDSDSGIHGAVPGRHSAIAGM